MWSGIHIELSECSDYSTHADIGLEKGGTKNAEPCIWALAGECLSKVDVRVGSGEENQKNIPYLKEWHSMEWLFSHAYQIYSNSYKDKQKPLPGRGGQSNSHMQFSC